MVHRFEDFELDASRRELRRGGAGVEVEPQVFDLLLYLIEHRDRVVGKDELLDHIWQGRIVSESTLSSRISAARRALGDDGTTQRLIRTVPRRGFRFAGELASAPVDELAAEPVPIAAGGALERPDRPTLAVLPFTNLSGDADQEYFSDGIAEDIISALSRFRLFFVIARNSSFAFKGEEGAAARLADEMGVQYIVEGSVRKSGDRIRVAAQLGNTRTGQQIWSDRYDRELADLFAIQDEITENVVGSVAPELLTAEMDRVRRQTTPMLDTWSRVMRARALLTHFDAAMNGEAMEQLEEALRHDPDSSLAHADLAFVHWLNITFSWAEDMAAEIEGVRVHARRAVELDGRDDWARCMYGLSKLYDGPDYDAVLRELATALEINPNMAFAHSCMGWMSALVGEVDRAGPHAALAIEHSPRDPFVSLFWAGSGYAAIAAGDLEQAIECGRRSVACVPPFLGGYRILAASLAMEGEAEEAKSVGAELMRRAPAMTLDIVRLQQPWRDEGKMTAFLDALRAAGVPD